METHDLVLNLHGEMPSSPDSDVTVMNAEEAFLPTLRELHQKFPKLRIVLEHCTTAVAVDTVLSCGANVAGEWSAIVVGSDANASSNYHGASSAPYE